MTSIIISENRGDLKVEASFELYRGHRLVMTSITVSVIGDPLKDYGQRRRLEKLTARSLRTVGVGSLFVKAHRKLRGVQTVSRETIK